MLSEFEFAAGHLQGYGCAAMGSSHDLVSLIASCKTRSMANFASLNFTLGKVWFKQTVIDILMPLGASIEVVLKTGDVEVIEAMKGMPTHLSFSPR